MTLLRDLMLADLERGLAIARDGHEVVPAWRILAPDGDFLILTQFDPDKPEQRERAFALVPRFMAWKLATGFVLTAETWLGPERTRSGEEAVLTIGVSHHERMAVIRRIRRTPALAFAPAEWLPADALDDMARPISWAGHLRLIIRSVRVDPYTVAGRKTGRVCLIEHYLHRRALTGAADD